MSAPTVPAARPIRVLGILGTQLDLPTGPRRWEKWRPTVSLVQQEQFAIHRIDLLVPPRFEALARVVHDDVRAISPTTQVDILPFPLVDPWDFEEVWSALHDRVLALDISEDEEVWVHLTTGTHVAQISWFLLVEAGFLRARLAQTGPPDRQGRPRLDLVDLDRARYDKIAARYAARAEAALGVLKQGIATKNIAYNDLMSRIERVAVHSQAPMLIEGPTGSGKSALAKRIYEVARSRRSVTGTFVDVNCATLRGDAAMSTLFGHVRGAYTGADQARDGLLRAADRGVLFLDEIGELGRDEQAMLLLALEEGRFRPVGSDREVTSRFRLIAGTNRPLLGAVHEGLFREDLLARLDTWTFRLPALAERREDIEPNLDVELERLSARLGRSATFNREARGRYLRWACSPRATWKRNFRDLSASVERLVTLAEGRRIDVAMVDEEIARLEAAWGLDGPGPPVARWVDRALGERVSDWDRFDLVQLEDVLEVCARSRTLAEAGRALFAASRARRANPNDSDRLRKYLARFGLQWEDLPRST